MKRCYVRFTPESRHSRLRQECPLRANSGHRRCQFARQQGSGLEAGASLPFSQCLSRDHPRVAVARGR
jgi:hypothetical protein